MTAEAFEELERLRDTKDPLAKFRRQALMATMGYFLQDKDLPRLVEYFKRITNPSQSDAAPIVASLSFATIRKVKGGKALLDRVCGFAFWEDLPAPLSRRERIRLYANALRFVSFSSDYRERREKLKLAGFTKSEREFLGKALAVADEMNRSYRKDYTLLYRMLPEWHKRRDLAGKEPWLADVNAPSVLPPDGRSGKRSPDGASRAPTSPAAAGPGHRPLDTAAIVKEGVAAYGQLLDRLFSGKYLALSRQIMDNGRPVPAAKVKRGWAGFVEAIKQEQALLAEVKAKGLLAPDRCSDFQVRPAPRAKAKGAGESGRSPAPRSEDVTLLFTIPGTSAIYRKHIPQVGGRSAEMTITRKGDLQVYMRRINGKWYWNPFGW